MSMIRQRKVCVCMVFFLFVYGLFVYFFFYFHFVRSFIHFVRLLMTLQSVSVELKNICCLSVFVQCLPFGLFHLSSNYLTDSSFIVAFIAHSFTSFVSLHICGHWCAWSTFHSCILFSRFIVRSNFYLITFALSLSLHFE